MVIHRGEKLVEQPSVCTVDLDHIVSSVLRHLGCAAKAIRDILDHAFRHFRCHDPVGINDLARSIYLSIPRVLCTRPCAEVTQGDG